MKHEWKKLEKEWYGAKNIPALVDVPSQNFIMISGKGNPNETDFSDRVSALYALAYAIKMGYKAESASREIQDFSVYPLEGVWKQKEAAELVKEKLEYTIMIRQPDFITEPMVNAALGRVKVKKPNPLYEEIRFGAMQDGRCVQILHTGAFDDEPASFAKMDDFTQNLGFKRDESSHREIYLNNANRTEPGKLKTILRYSVS